MRSIEVEITGVSPLLMHRFSEEDRAQLESRSSRTVARASPEEQADRAAYRFPAENGHKGNLCLPADNLLGSIRRAASFHKIGRRGATMSFCAGVFITPELLDLGVSKYEIDARSVVTPATKGRRMCYRPRLNNWKLHFTLQWNDKIIPNVDLVRAVMDDAGQLVGVAAFRPEKKGSFGRFMVTSWS